MSEAIQGASCGLSPSRLPNGTRFEYMFSAATFDRAERHDWSIIHHGIGAVGIWARPSGPGLSRSERWYGGIEVHHASPPDYADFCGHQEHCWLIGGPCWTDGSGLQFIEEVERLLPEPRGAPLGLEACEAVLPILIHRYHSWLPVSGEAQTEGETPKESQHD